MYRTAIRNIFILCIALIYVVHAQNWDKSTYGKDWVAFTDKSGKPIYINLTLTPGQVHEQENTRRVGPAKEPKFYLYNKEHGNAPETLGLKSPSSRLYKPNGYLTVVAGGWMSTRDSDSAQLITNAILAGSKIDENIVVVDWNNFQSSWNYFPSAKATEEVSELVKDFLHNLIKQYKIEGSKIHLIGHSLGAHVVGLTGAKLKKVNINVARVTGLDPARPYFEIPKVYPGISKNSASFVDIIHTSAAILGIKDPAGHADFYPGGGTKQPACCPNSKDLIGVCEHSCAYIYFEKSYKSIFQGYKCPNYADFTAGKCKNNEEQSMGISCSPKATGSYFLDVLHF